jgi:hypothetical protein
MNIDTNDHRATKLERALLRTIAIRLNGGVEQPPSEYKRAAQRMFAQACDQDGAVPVDHGLDVAP